MKGEPFSLLASPWLPVRRASGGSERIRPADLMSRLEDDPVVAFDWPRADLDAASREFMIGLLSTACWDVIFDDDWEEWWKAPPEPAELEQRFAPFEAAFVLDGAGPRFMQDQDELGGSPVPVGALLIDSPGANALKKNIDLFVKRGRIGVLSRGAAAMALFALQTFAPAGGAGHRVSLRGGGPLTTLLLPGPAGDDEPVSLWHQLWTNVCWHEAWHDPAQQLERIFPWLVATRVSDKGQITTPEDVHPAQAFWGMPRRIRFDFEANAESVHCDLSGEIDRVVVRSYQTQPHGTNYSAWSQAHPLSPYYRVKPSDPEWLPRHPQPGRLGYRDWVGLVLADTDADALVAPAAALSAARSRLRRTPLRRVRFGASLLASGYDMDNMKPRGFVESRMPVRIVGETVRRDFEALTRQLVGGAREAESILGQAIRTALWDREAPKAGTGARGLARDRFWDETETPFHHVLSGLARALETDAGDEEAARERLSATPERWHGLLRSTAIRIFDEIVPLDRLEERRFERIDRGKSRPGGPIVARCNLLWGLTGCGPAGGAFFGALGLSPPKPACKAKRGRAA